MSLAPEKTRPFRHSLCLAFFSLCAAIMPTKATGQVPTPVITSSTVPSDVAIPAGFTDNPIAFFDDYSWRTFIAMIWPAKTGQRGQPDTSQTIDGTGPRVFDTYKSACRSLPQ